MASHNFPVAVIGMAVNLPGADNCEEFWELMVNKGDTVATFPDQRAEDVKHVMPVFKGQFVDENNPFFTGSFFKSVDKFDADVFGINPKEAMFIEPEQRMFLQTTWELLEDAGYASKIRNSKTGVYVGNTVNKYKYILTENHPSISHGNHSPFISSRVSYTFNLGGPAMMVATGCSSSLLAVHLACQGLLSGDCDMAIAGGVTLDLLPISLKTDIWNQLGITSPNAKCRAFDANAKGIAKAEGCGIVLLKPLEKAIADGDHIYGVLEATTANQDGHSQGITAPHPGAQANMLVKAWELANITPDRLGYIEAHGTGTELGDPIEIMGITKAYQKMTKGTKDRSEKIPVGSVKSNIGHLADGAAGVVSLIKVLLCIEKGAIPPVTNFTSPNPHINWDKAPVVVNDTFKEWESTDLQPRYGSVSAFGLLGTNIHAVVKEYTAKPAVLCHVTPVEPQVLCLAAKTRHSLYKFVSKFADYLENHSTQTHEEFSRICQTCNTGRELRRFKNRLAVLSTSPKECARALRNWAEKQEAETHGVVGETLRVSNPTEKQQEVICQFLNGDNVDWGTYYKIRTGGIGQHIGMLPTYVFEETRYWPEVSETLNKQYLILEHQIPHLDHHNYSGSDNSEAAEVTGPTAFCQDEHRSGSTEHLDVFEILSKAFNNALGVEHNWTEEGDTNLFDLGLDSLVYTHLTMHLMQVFNNFSEPILTQSDLHSNPSFNEISGYLETKLNNTRQTVNLTGSTRSAQANTTPYLAGQIPLSYSQRRLWVIQKMEQVGSTYNATNCLKITGGVDVDVFKRSVENVIKRHDAFFITFKEKDAEPYIVYDWDTEISLEVIDVSMSHENPEETAMQMYEVDYKGTFDLSNGPLMRIKLYKISETQHIFTMVIDHIIFDGWSHFLFYNELWDNYKRSTQGCKLQSEIQQPFSIYFSENERDASLSMSSRTQKDLAYWMDKLESPLPLTTFPGDKKRPHTFTYDGGRLTRFIDMKIFNRLNNCVESPHTMFHSILSSVFVLLQYFNPTETDFLVGIPVTGRYTMAMRDVIGCFINTLVIRIATNKSMTFVDLLQSVSKTCYEAQEHQMTPFDLLVSKLKLPRNTSISPVFSVNVCYHNEELKHGHIDPPEDIEMERKLLHNGTSKWDMQFDFLEEGDEMRFTLEYYKGVFSDSYAETIADMLNETLQVLANNPETAITRSRIGSTSLVHGPSLSLGHQTVTQSLIDSLENYPDSKVQDIEGNIHTYASLKQDAARLANFFINDCRLQKGNRIGLLYENSYEGLAVIVASLLTGLVYVPLNQDHPKARLEHVVRGSKVKMICFVKESFPLASYLLWTSEYMENIFCVDGINMKEATEIQENPLMDIELWDCVAEEASSDIEGGGWKSSYTGEHMSPEEMIEYVQNVLHKLETHVNSKSVVLEIGCASGLTTQALCPLVNEYVATDLSQTMTDRIRDKNLKNVRAHCVPAHEVGTVFKERKFDLIILNSVVHCFPGYNYLKKVLTSCADMLTSNGKIFIGDVMDLTKRDALQYSLKAFKTSNPKSRTKTDLSAELFIPKGFFESFDDVFPTVTCTSKIGSIENELTKYRYDVLMTKDAAVEKKTGTKRNVLSTDDLKPNEIELPKLSIEQDDDAYVLFTSGTTGTPKGVRIGQKSLLNYCIWASTTYELDTGSTIPLFSPLTFDFTVTCIIPPLLKGSTIEIFKPFSESYEEIAESKSLTVAKFSPLQLETIIGSTGKPLGINTFILGGEELTYSLLKKLRNKQEGKPFKVWNEYGPTEATVGCVVQCIDHTEIEALKEQYIPIGQPINNVTVAVTSDAMPVTLGTKGFLSIGGCCLTNGFLSTNAGSRDAFKSACWGQDGSLMYTTTDIVSCNVQNDQLFYFGRDSTDITKINEMRVDIAEVQAAVSALSFVADAWVCRFECEGTQLLGAAVKLVYNAHYTNEDLKGIIPKELSHILPLHCVPKVTVQLTDAPTNKNGKKDTNTLTKLFKNAMEKKIPTENTSSLPSETESKVQRIWQEILPIDRLPNLNEDFFFELSGDSLQAIHLVRKMRNAGFHVSVNDVFRHPTVKSLCRSLQICNPQTKTIENSDKPFRPTPITERYMTIKGKSDRFAVPAMLEMRNHIKPEVVQKALRAVIQKHKSLSSRYFTENGSVFQEYTDMDSDKPTVTVAQLSQGFRNIVEDPVFKSTCGELEDLLDVGQGNLLNAALFQSEEKQYCLIVVHHITVDIVSWQQILEDLSVAMKDVISGNEPILPPSAAPFHMYCEELWKEAEKCPKEEIMYWQNVTQNIRSDKVFGEITDQSLYVDAKWESQSMDSDIVRKLSIAIEGTDEAVILTALGKAFSKLQDVPLTVCLESHGRQLDIDTTDTVGWCTSMFPFTIDVGAEEDFVLATSKVKKHIQEIPMHGVRYGPLAGKGKINAELPSAMFVFQGSLDAASKELFKAGDATFKYLPWVEVLTHDLENGNYHRDDQDPLDFPFEVICWFHSGQLRIGSLFDSKKISGEWVRLLLQEMKTTILVASNAVNDKTRTGELVPGETIKHDGRKSSSGPIQILTSFTIAPNVKSICHDILLHEGLGDSEVVYHELSDFYPLMLREESSDYGVTIAVIKCMTTEQREEIESAIQTYVLRNKGKYNKLVVIQLDMPNSIPLSKDKLQDVHVQSLTINEFDYNSVTDFDFNMPLTEDGYRKLSITTARTVLSFVRQSEIKVICVDGDYTLWCGECANNDVTVTEASRLFQTFLLQKVNEGYLLVLLSKNQLEDVESTLSKEEMILKREHFVHLEVNWNSKSSNIWTVARTLDLNIQSFLFIDDSSTECEEMLRAQPQVKTLRFPAEEALVKTFVSSLWILDKTEITSESASRTEMYRNEVSRKMASTPTQTESSETYSTLDFSSLLTSWKMKINICKTTINDVISHSGISKRLSELLHRTNQFKLNDVFTRLSDFNDQDKCFVVSMDDAYGQYGIIAVIVMDHEASSYTVKQWVMSCRALGRKVEDRLANEIAQSEIDKNIRLYFTKTGKNIPMENFLQQRLHYTENSGEIVLDKQKLKSIRSDLHEIHVTEDLSVLVLPAADISIQHGHDSQATSIGECFLEFAELEKWTKNNCSERLRKHISQNHILPSFILENVLEGLFIRKLGDMETNDMFEEMWIRVLKTQKRPSSQDCFVKHGGSSFQAVFLISEVWSTFGVKLELIDVLTQTYGWIRQVISTGSAEEKTVPAGSSLSQQIELSQAQKRMWLMQTSMRGSTAYTETTAMKVESNRPIDEIAVLLTDRHPIVTARMHPSENRLYFQSNKMRVLEREFDTMEDLINSLTTSKPVFDQTDEALSQILSFNCGVNKVIVIHIHHILVDDVTLHNIKTSLASFAQHQLLETQMFDKQRHLIKPNEGLVKSENAYLQSLTFEHDRQFWENTFEDCPEEASLGLKQISEVNGFMPQSAAITRTDVPDGIRQQIRRMCQEYGVTEFQYLLAMFVLVSQRYSGTEDVLLAIPVSDRGSEHFDEDGLFVNTVLFRYKCNMAQTLEEHVKRVASEWLGSYSHSRYPVNYVCQIIWEKHGKSLTSICGQMFNFATFETDEHELYVKPKHAKMPFSLDAVKTKHGLQLVCENAEDLIDVETVENILGSLVNLLSIGQSMIHSKIKDIEFLTEIELQMIDDFSKNTMQPTEYVHVFELFSRNVKTLPDSIALTCETKRLTYKELNNCVHSIASKIIQASDQENIRTNPVLVYMDKSEKAIAGMLAAWKVGGFFMPVSPMYNSNLSEIIDSVNPCVVLVGNSFDETKCDEGTKCRIVNTETEDNYMKTEHVECTTLLDLSRPAYVIRTSGSTGRPKEILIDHKGLATLASAWRHEYQMLDFNVSLLQWAPLSFDVFIGDIVRGLCCSPGKILLCPDDKRLDTDYIVSLIRSEEISIAEMTPQFGLMLTQGDEDGYLDSLRIFILGSDTLQKELYNKVKQKLKPHQRLLNSYGMTEATIDSSFFEGDELPVTRGGNVPIGKPLPGVVMQVLDPITLKPSPVGVVGELFIGGDVVGTGEVNVVTKQDGVKLLKTNDFACWLISGDLELCGRKDTMCKLRGFRIDCSHIENVILEHCDIISDVSVSILTETKENGQNEHLCAFVVTAEKITKRADVYHTIKDKIHNKLPYYMMPDFIECVDNIPLSQNGKVDKKLLPSLKELYRTKTDTTKQHETTSPTADILRQLFAESLGIEPSFINDERTFMEQGGHSLIMMAFNALIKERTMLQLSIVDIFSYPSITLLTEKATDAHTNRHMEGRVTKEHDGMRESQSTRDIAICGVGIRLPNDTRSLGEVWDLLENQVDLVSDFPKQRKDDVLSCADSELSNSIIDADEYRGAFLNEIDKFDNEIFNIPATEAQSMAPEQRLFLEVASETLAQGTNISEVNGSNIGVFLSQAELGYAKLSHSDEATSVSGLMPGMIATRLAYYYNLKGPTMLVDTACSSGITALKTACESVARGECKAALVGGMNIVLYPSRTGVHGTQGIMSPDFRCRPFDRNANGTTVGEGVICFYIEPLQEALKQNKHVYAVIKSIGINSVGTGNGITAPTAQSQEDAIQSSLHQAKISPGDVSFIETHGTGTVLGDRIELSALSRIYNTQDTERKLPLGSVKSNLGHLDYAAGLAGLLKIVVGYMFEAVPATSNFKTPHKELTDSFLYVPVKNEPWPASKSPRIAGLSSFGLTGTNTHMIVSDATKASVRPVTTSVPPLILCGATHDHIRQQAAVYEKLIQQTVCARKINTLQDVTISIITKLSQLQKTGILHVKHRVAVVESDAQKVLDLLAFIKQTENEMQMHHTKYENKILASSTVSPLKICYDVVDTYPGTFEFLASSRIETSNFLNNANVDQEYCAPGIHLPIFNSQRHWLRPCVKQTRNGLGLVDILHGKISNTRELVRTLNLSPSQDLLHAEARFCCSIILNLLKETGLKDAIEDQRPITLEESFAKTGMLDKYDKLFFIMIRELFNSGFVLPEGTDSTRLNLDVYAFRCRHVHLPLPKMIAEEAVAKYPQWADCFRFPLHCSEYMKKVLTGHMSPLSVIYPQGDLNFMYQFDKLGDLLGDVYYNMYMQIIVEYAAKLSRRGKTVRILEVGAGMGHVTRQLLPSLAEIPNVEYWFTDLGRAFVENAKTLFENYISMMRFSTFDITKSAVKQGLLGTYDIVISYNVIHTTESVYKSVNNLKTCLGDNGTLFIVESAKNETWATLAWGVLDGWWYFKDYDLRPYEPMLEPEKWEEVLEKAGFTSIHSCPVDAEERKHVEKFLFVCSNKEKPAEYIPAPSESWWKCIDLTTHRHADFDTHSSCSDESGLGDEGRISRSIVKSELKRIWCELLDLEDMNEDEDFNALGGESLLAIQMMTMVRKRIGYQLEIADTFCYTSLGALGDYISDQLEAELSQKSNSESSTNNSDTEQLTQPLTEESTFKSGNFVTNNPGTMLMFPGQGSQKVGMCTSVAHGEAAKKIFDRAEDILGYNLLDICIGPQDILKEKLMSTEFVQVALFVSCLAKISQLEKDQPEILRSVTHVAGLSVGEFAALVYAKVLTFDEALELVQHRGRAMEKEVQKSSTAMASVLGPSKIKLEQFLQKHFPNAVISTCLADNQHTVAGIESDIEMLISMLTLEDQRNDLSVMDVRRLRVAGAFHSSYMGEAESAIRPLIEKCVFNKPQIPIIMNVTGELCDDPNVIKTLVSRQIVETVQWRDTMVRAHQAGVRRYIEVAPARVLSSIVRTRIEECRGCTSELIQV